MTRLLPPLLSLLRAALSAPAPRRPAAGTAPANPAGRPRAVLVTVTGRLPGVPIMLIVENKGIKR